MQCLQRRTHFARVCMWVCVSVTSANACYSGREEVTCFNHPPPPHTPEKWAIFLWRVVLNRLFSCSFLSPCQTGSTVELRYIQKLHCTSTVCNAAHDQFFSILSSTVLFCKSGEFLGGVFTEIFMHTTWEKLTLFSLPPPSTACPTRQSSH